VEVWWGWGRSFHPYETEQVLVFVCRPVVGRLVPEATWRIFVRGQRLSAGPPTRVGNARYDQREERRGQLAYEPLLMVKRA